MQNRLLGWPPYFFLGPALPPTFLSLESPFIWTKLSFSVKIEQSDVGSSTA